MSVGRQFSAALYPQVTADLWGWDNTTNSLTINTGLIANIWYNDAVTYAYSEGGFSASAQVAQKQSNPGWAGVANRSPYSMAIGYAAGPWSLRGGYERPADGTSWWSALSGTYDFKVVELRGFLGDGKDYQSKPVRSWQVSAVVPVGLGQIRASYGQYKHDDTVGQAKRSVGYYYYLSKRTAVYSNFAHDNKAQSHPSGYELGLQHVF